MPSIYLTSTCNAMQHVDPSVPACQNSGQSVIDWLEHV